MGLRLNRNKVAVDNELVEVALFGSLSGLSFRALSVVDWLHRCMIWLIRSLLAEH